jgi:hypothetical protein
VQASGLPALERWDVSDKRLTLTEAAHGPTGSTRFRAPIASASPARPPPSTEVNRAWQPCFEAAVPVFQSCSPSVSLCCCTTQARPTGTGSQTVCDLAVFQPAVLRLTTSRLLFPNWRFTDSPLRWFANPIRLRCSLVVHSRLGWVGLHSGLASTLLQPLQQTTLAWKSWRQQWRK